MSHQVVCSNCGSQIPASQAREMIILWSRSESGRGTLTDVKLLVRQAIWQCDPCVSARIYKTSPTPASIRGGDVNLDRLEELANAATPDGWDEKYILGAVRHIARNVENDVFMYEPADFCWDRYNDGPFIAACSPQTVKALIGVARAVMRMRPWHHLGDDDIADIRAAIQALEELT